MHPSGDISFAVYPKIIYTGIHDSPCFSAHRFQHLPLQYREKHLQNMVRIDNHTFADRFQQHRRVHTKCQTGNFDLPSQT